MAKELIDSTSFEQNDQNNQVGSVQHIQVSMGGNLIEKEVLTDQKKGEITDRTFMNLTERKNKETIDLLPDSKVKGRSNKMLTKFGEITASKVLDKLDFKDDDLRIFSL